MLIFHSDHQKLNNDLTKTIIRLHHCGYTDDFLLDDGRQHLLNTAGEEILHYQVCVIYQGYDQLCGSYKYLHAIETTCGHKGLVLSSCPIFARKAEVGA